MNNILLQHLSKKVGVQLKVRDKDKWMDESLEVRGKAIAKELAKYEGREMLARDSEAITQNEVIDKFYSRGNKVD